jgi:hypothetical protein
MIYPATYDIVVLQNATYRMQLTVTQSGGTPINLSGYTIDSDICGVLDDSIIASFTPTIVNAASGIFELELPPATTSGIEAGVYNYDVSATEGTGDRYYWLKGQLTVEPTCSRNT